MSICRPTGKVRFSGQDAAIAAAASLQARGDGRAHDRPIGVYRCPICRDFHVGHRPVDRPPPTQKAAIELPPPQLDAPRCELACKKPVAETVETPRGPVRACRRHADQLRAAYETADGRRTLRSKHG